MYMKRMILACALAALPFAAVAQGLTDEEVFAGERICAEHYHVIQSQLAPKGYDPGWEARCVPIKERADAIRARNLPQQEKDKAAQVEDLVKKLER